MNRTAQNVQEVRGESDEPVFLIGRIVEEEECELWETVTNRKRTGSERAEKQPPRYFAERFTTPSSLTRDCGSMEAIHCLVPCALRTHRSGLCLGMEGGRRGFLKKTSQQILGHPMRRIFLERTLEKICEQSEVIQVAETSSPDRNLQRTVEQILDDTRREPTSRISERICEQRGVMYLFPFS